MDPIMEHKREISSLIPYRKAGEGYEFFLQKRAATARNNQGLFGLFGGGLEQDETPEEGMYREISEELSYVPTRPIYFSRYETNKGIIHVFLEEVRDDFESKVVVGEGEYGRFLATDEVLHARDVSMLAQMIIHHIVRDFLEK
jgi:8-oxo-dGTP pyrophosphatase MutT (NUDIX family)